MPSSFNVLSATKINYGEHAQLLGDLPMVGVVAVFCCCQHQDWKDCTLFLGVLEGMQQTLTNLFEKYSSID